MRMYRDPETGRFISKTRWEEIQRDLERESRQADDADDFEDYDYDFDEEEYLGEE